MSKRTKKVFDKIFGSWKECPSYWLCPDDALCYGQDVNGKIRYSKHKSKVADKCIGCPKWGQDGRRQ